MRQRWEPGLDWESTYHRVFMGRETPGDLNTPEIFWWQCHICSLLWEDEGECRNHAHF